MSFVENLEPQALWQHFDRILTIPRASKHEEHMRDFVVGVARSHGLPCRVDATGNVVVRKPASPGREGAATTILQSHLDMVQEKNSDVAHDFDRDPIRPRREGDYLKATGTTLGSDNGIGVAAMLAVMVDRELVHGPLELLFTVDEETGLTGAGGLAGDLLDGRQLINLDSEEEGALCVGCAGGADSSLTLPLAQEPVAAGAAVLGVKLSGLKGGHSGVDIHLQRGNAIKLLARALWAASSEVPLRLAAIGGGSAHNAIPREARAEVVVASGDEAKLRRALEREAAAIADEIRTADPGLVLEIAAGAATRAWSAATSHQVLALLTSLPHGIATMSYDIPGLVETSTNLATVVERDGALVVGMSSRSSVASALRALRQRIRAVGALAGAAVVDSEGYPGWKPNLDSRLLKVVTAVHERLLGSKPSVGAIHAGLECGIIGEKYEGMDMISLGPQIEFPHSPDERVLIPSVERFYRLLTTTLEELAA